MVKEKPSAAQAVNATPATVLVLNVILFSIRSRNAILVRDLDAWSSNLVRPAKVQVYKQLKQQKISN